MSAASIRMKPPRCSLVSANGPSLVDIRLLRTLTVTALVDRLQGVGREVVPAAAQLVVIVQRVAVERPLLLGRHALEDDRLEIDQAKILHVSPPHDRHWTPGSRSRRRQFDIAPAFFCNPRNLRIACRNPALPSDCLSKMASSLDGRFRHRRAANGAPASRDAATMHVMEVALFANFVNQRRQSDEPLPEQWPRPRRSRVARAALAGAWRSGSP